MTAAIRAQQKYPEIDVVGRIQLHDNVFVGVGATLLPGIEIGPDAVVAAGAVVSRTVPPGVVAAGVPARPICTLAEYEAKILRRDRSASLEPSPRPEETSFPAKHLIFGQVATSRPRQPQGRL